MKIFSVDLSIVKHSENVFTISSNSKIIYSHKFEN